jgi:short-subunit dehydrogenase
VRTVKPMKRSLIWGAAGAALGTVARPVLRRRFVLRDRTVAITGASRGLGLALAREYGRRGARVALCARDEEEVAAARADLEERGVEVFTSTCDLTRQEQATGWVETVRREFGEIDVLVNNAGVIHSGPYQTLTREDFDEAMGVHFFSPMHLTYAVLPHMRRQGAGRIVNISSFGGLMGVPHLTSYCASKFALTGFSEALRTELSGQGVFVTTVCPWLLRTGSARHAQFKGQVALERLWFNAGSVMPLLTMQPDRAARRIVEASNRGRAQLVLTPQGKAVVRLKALFPGAVLGIAGMINRLLPSAPEGGTDRVEGVDVPLPRPLRWMNRRAGRRYHQYVH